MIPHGTPSRLLALDAPYVDQKYTPADVEVALPMAALGELHREGHIGAPAPNHASFCGGILRPLPGLADSVESLHRALRDDGTTGVILLPTCSICVQTTCILARELEKRGMPTVAISLLPELSAIVGAPRTLVVRFPFGAPAGDPGNGDLHRAVLSEAIDLLLEAKAAGEVRTSALAWRR
jgi:glycine/betaine/sarcosine/D-proline reductase family selenoprotein B